MDISSETAATATPVLHEKRPVLFQESRSLKEFPILAELRRSQDEAENLEEATEPAEAPAPQPVEDVEVPAPSDAPSQPATEDEDGDEEPDEPSPEKQPEEEQPEEESAGDEAVAEEPSPAEEPAEVEEGDPVEPPLEGGAAPDEADGKEEDDGDANDAEEENDDDGEPAVEEDVEVAGAEEADAKGGEASQAVEDVFFFEETSDAEEPAQPSPPAEVEDAEEPAPSNPDDQPSNDSPSPPSPDSDPEPAPAQPGPVDDADADGGDEKDSEGGTGSEEGGGDAGVVSFFDSLTEEPEEPSAERGAAAAFVSESDPPEDAPEPSLPKKSDSPSGPPSNPPADTPSDSPSDTPIEADSGIPGDSEGPDILDEAGTPPDNPTAPDSPDAPDEPDSPSEPPTAPDGDEAGGEESGGAPSPSPTPTDPPEESPEEEEEEGPSDTPEEAPEDTPEEAPEDTPEGTPDDTPAETPGEAAAESPVEAPVESPEETPEDTPPPTLLMEPEEEFEGDASQIQPVTLAVQAPAPAENLDTDTDSIHPSPAATAGTGPAPAAVPEPATSPEVATFFEAFPDTNSDEGVASEVSPPPQPSDQAAPPSTTQGPSLSPSLPPSSEAAATPTELVGSTVSPPMAAGPAPSPESPETTTTLLAPSPAQAPATAPSPTPSQFFGSFMSPADAPGPQITQAPMPSNSVTALITPASAPEGDLFLSPVLADAPITAFPVTAEQPALQPEAGLAPAEAPEGPAEGPFTAPEAAPAEAPSLPPLPTDVMFADAPGLALGEAPAGSVVEVEEFAIAPLQQAPEAVPEAPPVWELPVAEAPVGAFVPVAAAPKADPPPTDIPEDQLVNVEAIVSSPDEFIQAIHAGVEQIKLVNHIDLRKTPPLLSAQLAMGVNDVRSPAANATAADQPTQHASNLDLVLHRKLLSRRLEQLPDPLEDNAELHALPAVMSRTQSIRGDCTNAPLPVNPGGDALAPLQRNEEGFTQCVVFTPSDLFRVEDVDAQQLWIDNLYLRIARNTAAVEQDKLPSLLAISSPNAEVWATNTAFQSDGTSCRGVALDDPTSKAYVGDAAFYSFGPETPAVVSEGALTLQAVMFSSNPVNKGNSAATMPLVYGGPAPAGIVALENCTFTQNFGRDDLGQGPGGDTIFYSDELRTSTVVEETDNGKLYRTDGRIDTLALSQIPPEQRERLINTDAAFFLDAAADSANSRDMPIKQILSGDAAEGQSGSISGAVIGAIVAAAAVFVILGALLAVYVQRGRKPGRSGTNTSNLQCASFKYGTNMLSHRSYADGSSNVSSSRGVGNNSYNMLGNQRNGNSTGTSGGTPPLQPSPTGAPAGAFMNWGHDLHSPHSGRSAPGGSSTPSPRPPPTFGLNIPQPAFTIGPLKTTNAGSGSGVKEVPQVFQAPKPSCGIVTVGRDVNPRWSGPQQPPTTTPAVGNGGTSVISIPQPGDTAAFGISQGNTIQRTYGSNAQVTSTAMSTSLMDAVGSPMADSSSLLPEDSATPHSKTTTNILAQMEQSVYPRRAPTSASEGTSDDLLQLLNDQLNMLQGEEDGVVLGKFRMSGVTSRRVAGQGVIQQAQGIYDATAYSIKFCTSFDTFDRERGIYTNPALGSIVPRVALVHDNMDNSFRDPKGVPLAPLMVLERGEPFDDWAKRTQPSIKSVAQAVSQIAQLLAELHAAGYVHRDLKPANVMYFEEEGRWALFDFGCAALAGRRAPLRFSLAYAAPEVVVNARDTDCDGTMHVVPELDVWSLGVMAYEVLMGERAFGSHTRTRSQVIRMLVGEESLPWQVEEAAVLEAKLGNLQGPLLELLVREKVHRPNMQHIADRCRAIAACMS